MFILILIPTCCPINISTFKRARRVISKAESGSWGPVGNPGGDLEPKI